LEFVSVKHKNRRVNPKEGLSSKPRSLVAEHKCWC